MSTAQQADRGMEDGPIPTDTLNALIGRQALRTLGSPRDMLKMKVHPWGTTATG